METPYWWRDMSVAAARVYHDLSDFHSDRDVMRIHARFVEAQDTADLLNLRDTLKELNLSLARYLVWALEVKAFHG